MNKCSNFCTAMNGMEQADWSDWHISNNKGGKKQVASLSVGMSRTCQTLIRAYALTNMSKNEKEQFQAQIAMQYFTIGTSFHQVQGMHWKTAIKLLHPKDNVLTSRKQLASILLDKCHQELQSKVNLQLLVTCVKKCRGKLFLAGQHIVLGIQQLDSSLPVHALDLME